MAKKSVKAKICWIPMEQGGRSTPPPVGTRFCPLVIFENIEEKGTWSADFICTEVDEQLCSIVEFGYLVENAPIQNLKKGNRFSLFEGPHLVAKGEVLEE